MFKMAISVQLWYSWVAVQSLKNVGLVFQERALQRQGRPRLLDCANGASGGVRAVENVTL